MTNEYTAALETHNAASRIFTAAQVAYRSRKIGDAEFITARRAFDAATVLFDAAFAVEAALGEPEAVEANNDTQLALL